MTNPEVIKLVNELIVTMDQTVELVSRCEALAEAIESLGVKTDADFENAVPSELKAIFEASGQAFYTTCYGPWEKADIDQESKCLNTIEAFLQDS
jgi:hypothetical protein